MKLTRSRLTHFATGVVVLICLALPGCSRKQPTSAATKPAAANITKITVSQWGSERYLIYLPLYVAIEEGFLQKEGLDASLIFTGNDDQTFAAVIGGSAQFAVGDPAFAAISNEKGMPARVIATLVGGVAIWGVTNNDKVSVIKDVKGLAGLRVGTFPAPSTNYTLMKALIESNPEILKDTKIVQADIGSQLALLESNSADIAMVLEPAASLAEAQGYRIVYSSPQFHGPFTFTGITTTQDYLDKNKDTAQKFINGLEQALNASHQDPTIAVRVGRKLFPNLEPTVVENAVHRMLTENTYPQTSAVSDAAWNAVLQARVRIGDLKAIQPMSRSVDNTFAEKAKGSL